MSSNNFMIKHQMEINAFDGSMIIPEKAICELKDGFICYNDKRICFIDSLNTSELFYKYFGENPEEEVEKQRLIEVLKDFGPNDEILGGEMADDLGFFENISESFKNWIWNDNYLSTLSLDDLIYINENLQDKVLKIKELESE